MQQTSPAHLAHRGWWEVQSCVSVTFPGKDKACLICLARTNLCVRGKCWTFFFVVQLHSCCSLTMTDKAFLGRCAESELSCVWKLRAHPDRGLFFFFFPKSGSVPSCDTAVYKRAACQALHMCICYSSTCHVTKQLIQSWYYSISWRNAKLGGSVDRKALCTLILI